MPGDDQERFEDYLELEQFIAKLQAGQAAHPPQELTPVQASIYRMATLFHTVTPGVGEPDPDFAARLQAQLERDLQALQDGQRPPHTYTGEISTPPRKPRVSRRALLFGGATAAAAASVAAGMGIERMTEPAQQSSLGNVPPTQWFSVTTVAELDRQQAVQFTTANLIGYVVRSDGTNGDPNERGQIIAMSAACPHKGCIVNWDVSDRKFHCPCHGGVFTQDGGIDASSATIYLNPLPQLDVSVDQKTGEISVRMSPSDHGV